MDQGDSAPAAARSGLSDGGVVTTDAGPRPVPDLTERPSWVSRTRLALAPLFPVPEPTAWRWATVALSALAVVVATAVSLTRQAGPGALDSVWAEDGKNFLTDALNRSPIDAILTPFNGYFHLLPRLLVETTAFFPLEWAAAVMSATAALTCAVLATVVYHAAGAHVRSRLVRLLVSVPLVVAPVGQGGFDGNGGSVINGLATLQFPLMYTVFWLLLWMPARRLVRILAVAVVLVAALSSPLPVIYLPLVGVRLFVRHDGTGWAMLASLLAGAAVQFGGLVLGLTTRSEIGQTRPDPVWIATEYVRWVVPNALLGERWWADTLAHPTRQLALVVAAWIIVATAVAAALMKVARPNWHLAGVAFGASLAVTGVQLGSLGAVADRYLFVPSLLLTAALALLLVPARPDWTVRLPALALAGVLALVCGVNWQVPNHRALTKSWHDVVAEAHAKCVDSGSSRVTVPTHGSNGYWTVSIPCRKLR